MTRVGLTILSLSLFLVSAVNLPSQRLVGTTAATTSTTTSAGLWQPALATSWQWQLSDPVDPAQAVPVQMYDIDLFDNTAATVASLHAQGRKVVCYVNVGAWENWRPDASQFPLSVLGSNNGWPRERWLDIRKIRLLAPIVEARLDLCKAKGFDAMEPDNVDGYSNQTGFPLSYRDQIAYNSFVADRAHSRGLSVALKNDVRQVADLLPKFDFMIDEQCFQYQECGQILPFVQAGKAVFEVEYRLSPSRFCPQAMALGFNAMQKHVALDAWREPCGSGKPQRSPIHARTDSR